MINLGTRKKSTPDLPHFYPHQAIYGATLTKRIRARMILTKEQQLLTELRTG